MAIYNRELIFSKDDVKGDLTDWLPGFFSRKAPGTFPLRWAIVGVGKKNIKVEVTLMEEKKSESQQVETLKVQKSPTKARPFVSVFIVPTGVRAAIGGYIGDATPTVNLLSGISDFVITHPNVVNAALLNQARENVLYVEGYFLDRFFEGKIALRLARKNKIGVILDIGSDERESLNLAINTIEAVRAVKGVKIVDYIITEKPVGGKSIRTKSGAFVGEIKEPEIYLKAAQELIDKGANVIAVATEIKISFDDIDAYFRGEIPNPYGGTEAIISHSISKTFNLPCAHAPLTTRAEREKLISQGLVDPRSAGEVISQAYLGSVLQGLARSPQAIEIDEAEGDDLKITNVGALIIPAGCLGGIPMLWSSEKWDVPIIAVRENTTVLSITSKKLGMEIISAENYLEALTICTCLREGIDHTTLRRPLKKIKEAG